MHYFTRQWQAPAERHVTLQDDQCQNLVKRRSSDLLCVLSLFNSQFLVKRLFTLCSVFAQYVLMSDVCAKRRWVAKLRPQHYSSVSRLNVWSA